ncbi:hypothetical protein TVAG_212760 [Trichomonas vaginalis G3]|uniref:Uncharacterized protein n=1 Tax=Trichomonas vaginalis (strain ATCC PRA-98 / G3) TaxID=412133 RepID=A2E2R6_TRIV3|nr:hypothetical protein TVAGG3_0166620 [Trichomonas vaginalis G3]EAY13094.1 hypothetical protein TVAG_212760 [Trichomonas vaginalis G3]KAI5548283.1 hypothetical protein TVAGG3_0166620 [Trichomonas vaginalis G3]|eukprot:XP_001325317.1 hypothetical protein [Trichomonas vaginalis G3]
MSQVSQYADTWEYGTEITSKVTGPKYWKYKLKYEAQKAIALRDNKTISELIQASAQLRDQSKETFYTSQTMMILVSGLVSSQPDDETITNIGKELNRKLPKLPKTKVYKEILSRNANKAEDSEEFPEVVDGRLNIQSPGQYALVANENTDHSCDIILLRCNPIADLDIVETARSLNWDEYPILVNRIDMMPHDLDSWAAFHNLVINLNEAQVQEVANFVSYWKIIYKDLLNTEADDDFSHIVHFVFDLLHIIEQ